MKVLISLLKPKIAPCLLGSPGDQVNLRTTPDLPLLAVGRGGKLAPQQVTSPYPITFPPFLSLEPLQDFLFQVDVFGIVCKYPFHALPTLRQS